MPKTTRKYPTGGKKTTTKEGKKKYMKGYMKDYRKKQTAIRQALREGNFDLARQIMDGKAHVDVWE